MSDVEGGTQQDVKHGGVYQGPPPNPVLPGTPGSVPSTLNLVHFHIPLGG